MDNWEKISYVLSSGLRFKILIHLNKTKDTPSNIAKSLTVHTSHISKALKELHNVGLVECLTPSRRKTKFYSLTGSGKLVIRNINKVTA